MRILEAAPLRGLWVAAATLAVVVPTLALVGVGLWWGAVAVLFALIGGWLAATRLEVFPMVVIFGLYMNLPVVASHFHGVPSALGMVFFGLLAIPVAVRALLRRELVYTDAVFVTMLLLLAAKTIASLGSRDTEIALEKNIKYAIEGVVIYLFLLNTVRSEADLRKVLWALLASAAIVSAIVVHQEVTKDYTNFYGGLAQRHAEFQVGTEWRDRAAGPIGDPNYFAQILLIPLPIAVVFAFVERRVVMRLAALGVAVLLVAAVGLTYSRGGAIGLAFVLLLTALMLRVKLPTIIAGGLVLLVLLAAVSPEFFGRIASMVEFRNVVSGGQVEDRSFAGRLGENIAAWNVFIDHPIFGVGPDNFPLFYQEYADEIGMLYHAEDRPAHNLYLSVAAELGLFGLLTMLAVMLIPLVQTWATYRRFETERPFLARTAAALFVSIGGYMLTGVLLTLAYERYFWCLLALAGIVSLLGRLGAQPSRHAVRSQEVHYA